MAKRKLAWWLAYGDALDACVVDRLADKYADSAEVQPPLFPGLTIDLGKVWV